MAKTEVGLSVDVEFQSIGQMRKAIKEATGELIAMSEKFGTASKEATAAARRVAELKDRLGDAKALADTFNPDKKFVALGGAIQGAVSGFSALQGAMGLFGSESKDLEKMLLKVQSAMALQQGISGVFGAIDSFKNLAAEVKKSSLFMKANAVSTELASGAMKMFGVSVNTTSTSFRVLKGAIVSTGIGALVVAIGFAVEAMMDWYDSTNKQADSTEQLKKREEELKNEIDKTNDAIERRNQISNYSAQLEINNAKAKGKSAKEIRDLEMKFALEARGRAQDEEEAARKRLDGVINLSAAEKAILEKDLADKTKAREDAFQKERLLESQHKVQVFEENKAAQLKEQQKDETFKKEKKQAEENLTKFIQDENERRAKLRMDDFDKQRFEIEKRYAEQLAIAKKYKLDISELERLRFQDTKDFINKTTGEYRAGLEKQLGDFKSMLPKRATAETTLTVNQQTESNTRRQIAQDEITSLLAKIDAYFNAASSISNILKVTNQNELADLEEQKQRRIAAAGDNQKAVLAIEQETAIAKQKLLDRQFKRDKAMAIVDATINTFKAAAQVFARDAPGDPVTSLSIKVAALIATIAQGIANVASIRKVNVPGVADGGGGVGGGTTAPIPAALPATATAQMVNAQAINNLGNQATRAYVLNSDIQNNDQRNAYLQRNASIG